MGESWITLWAKRTAFTRSAITPPKVNDFDEILKIVICEPNVEAGFADFGRNLRSRQFEREPKFFVL